MGRSDDVKEAMYTWKKLPLDNHSDVEKWLAERDLPTSFAPLVQQQDIKNESALDQYLAPSLDELTDPFLMYDMDRAIERLQQAIMENEKIIIYGDYDADGITSSTVMKEAIEMVGGEVDVYLPNRFKDGYGPNLAVYERLVAEGYQLILTVDNGVSGHEAIAYAQAQGVDVIVTDHHALPDLLPEAYAVIHPAHPKGSYPFKDLAGVGVAFKFASALLEDAPLELLDLVAIGTVADLVSLTGENRLLVKHGLEMLKQTERVGLLVLYEELGIDTTQLGSEDIGFRIAPRLNALGRMEEAIVGVELLSTFEPEHARMLVAQVETTNQARQKTVQLINQEVDTLIEAEKSDIYVLANKGWHEGVLGIVASYVVEKTQRPAIILSISEEGHIAKGSARSVPGVNIFNLLKEVAPLLQQFGGHDMAAGLSVSVDKLAELKAALNNVIKTDNYDLGQKETLTVLEVTQSEMLSIDWIEKLAVLEPFGTDNPKPLLLLENACPMDARQIGIDHRHLKAQLQYKVAERPLDLIGFGFGEAYDSFSMADEVDVVGTLSINEWNGVRQPQLMLKDFKLQSTQLLDFREQAHKVKDIMRDNTVYFYFKEETAKQFSFIPTAQLIEVDESQPIEQLDIESGTSAVFLDCPVEAETLRTIVNLTEFYKIYLILLSETQAYLTGMPSRQDFAALYRVIQSSQEIDVRNKLPMLEKYLRIPISKIKFMINVFFDLNFVTIEDGLMTKAAEPVSTPLEASRYYKERQKQMKTEEFLLYGDINQIKDWLHQ